MRHCRIHATQTTMNYHGPIIGCSAKAEELREDVRNIACMEVPAQWFGQERFKPGDAIDFASTFFTHCRAYRVEWKGRFTLSGN